MMQLRRTAGSTEASSSAVIPCPSPVLGALLAVASAGRLVELSFYDTPEEAAEAARARGGARPDPLDPPDRETAPLSQVADQLARYFAGELRTFDLPLAPHGTPFQQAAWRVLEEVPWGETRTYGELADAVGRPGGARAIGMAMNRNPIAIVLPCHRILGSDRSLTGYGAGIERKRFLLELEGILQPRLI